MTKVIWEMTNCNIKGSGELDYDKYNYLGQR